MGTPKSKLPPLTLPMERTILRQEPEPPSIARTSESLEGFLDDLNVELVRLQATLVAPVPEPQDMTGCNLTSSVEGALERCCTKAACMVGFVRTINQRLGEFER